jgi:Ca-activated chloride channel family protein
MLTRSPKTKLGLTIACLLWAATGLAQSSLPQSSSHPRSSSPQPVVVDLPAHQRAWSANVVVPQLRAFNPQPPMQHLFPQVAQVAAPMRLPVSVSDVQAQVIIRDQLAVTSLDISLHNPAGFAQQAELLVPVPGGALVKGFDFQGSGQEPSAVLLPAAEARRLYTDIVSRVRDPALLEFIGQAVVRTSVFPVPAGGTQRVRLVYENLLITEGSRVDYLLPRSASLQVKVPWDITIEVSSTQALSTVFSPTHALTTLRKGPGRMSIRVPRAAAEPGAFRMSYLHQGKGLSASLFAYPDPAEGGGTFLFLAGLPQATAADEARPSIQREVTLVLDRSGSMSGKKLSLVRTAALQVLEGLDDGETFNLVVYNESVDPFAEEPVVKSNDSMQKARSWIGKIRSRGGTNIHDALLFALGPKPRPGTLPIVLFLTDGLPTIGQTSELAIRRMAERSNQAGRRIFTFGVGVDVNTPLLSTIASTSRAFATFVLPGEDVEVKVAKVFRSLSGPVLASPRLRVTKRSNAKLSKRKASLRQVSEVLPTQLPDLYEGDQLVVLGRYHRAGPATFELSGNFRGRAHTFRFQVDFNRASVSNAFVPRLWASRKIAVLVDAIRSSGADVDRAALQGQGGSLHDPRLHELVAEVVRLSRKYGVLTEYTAFLAREGTDLGQRKKVMAQAVQNFDSRALRTRSGMGSVNQEYNKQAQAKQQVLNPTNAYYDESMNRVAVSTVQQVADRAFFRKGPMWIDSRLVDKSVGQVKEIRFGSKAFWELVDKLARQGRQASISLRGDILLQVDGKTLLIRN